MKLKYEKNYVENGYLMNYEKGDKISPYSNWVLQFKIELMEIDPLIWRRFLVPSDYNFWDLHVAIQDAMGWLDYHLHHFEIKPKHKKDVHRIGIPDFRMEFLEPPEVFPGWEIPVTRYFNDLGITAEYEYDYGDSWWHRVTLEGYIFREKKTKYPICLDGERACPPEDCGGTGGYERMLTILSNKKNKDYDEMRKWAGKDWHPENFDKNAIQFSNPFKRWQKAFLKK